MTRATDYAVRVLTVLYSAPKRRVRTSELAAATAVPRQYLPKVVTPLVRRGWVQSHRGTGGGFSLVDGSQGITLLDLVELLEGPMHMQACTGPEGCQFSVYCPTHRVWLEAEEEVRGVLAKYTIAQLAELSHRQGLFVAGKQPP